MERDLALIGFGEAGSTFCAAARWAKPACAFDPDPSRKQAIEEAGISASTDVRSALADAWIVLSLVTADQALAAAQTAAAFLQPGACWIDMNSVAPDTKRRAAAAIEERGGVCVDAAILAPVRPAALNVPVLLAGNMAETAREELLSLGFTNVRVVGEKVGRASAIKLIRSVMVKGVEALTDEMMSAAEAAGVVDEVLASLDASEKSDSWFSRAAYNRERMATHGIRRAAEMEEAASTLQSLGVEPVMTQGTVRRQRAAAAPITTERNAA